MDLGLKGKRVMVTAAPRASAAPSSTLFWPRARSWASAHAMRRWSGNARRKWRAQQGRVTGTALDVTDAAALKAWIDGFAADGGIDHFVANVSALGTDNTVEGWRKAIEIDLVATVNAVLNVRPHLEARGSGATLTIIGTTSLVEVAGPTQPYRSVKAALVPMIKSMAIEMAPKGVRANMVSRAPSSRTATPGAASATPAATATSARWPATRPAAWARRRKWRTPSCSSPARPPRSSPASTSWSTAPSPHGCSTDASTHALAAGRPAGRGRDGRGLPGRQGAARPPVDSRRSRRHAGTGGLAAVGHQPDDSAGRHGDRTDGQTVSATGGWRFSARCWPAVRASPAPSHPTSSPC